MSQKAQDTIVKTLLKHLPQSLCQSLDEGLLAAAKQAYQDTSHYELGHLANALGQARHFHNNEKFSLAMDLAGIPHNALRGNDILIGQAGPLRLGRFSTAHAGWDNARRSVRRLELASHNGWLEDLFQPSLPNLFAERGSDGDMTVFIVSVYSGSIYVMPEKPVSVDIAVMDTTLSQRLFREPLSKFLVRYGQTVEQEDNAKPQLKRQKKREEDGES